MRNRARLIQMQDCRERIWRFAQVGPAIMNSYLFGGVCAAMLLTASFAQTVSFRVVAPKLVEHPARTVFEAKVRLRDDEVLVVREVKRSADGGVLLSDALVSARGMAASYRVAQMPPDRQGTKLRLLAADELVREPLRRTTHTDTCLELDFHDPDSGRSTTYGWFARVEKFADVQRRHPGYTPTKHSRLDAVSSGSRFMVSWQPAMLADSDMAVIYWACAQ